MIDRDEDAVTPEAFFKWLPWCVVGLLVLLGAIVTMTAGLPWETKEHAADTQRLMDLQMTNLANQQTETSRAVASLATSTANLTQAIAAFQAARDQEKDDAQKKLLAKEKKETRRYKIDLKYQRRHEQKLLKIDDGIIREQAAREGLN